MRREARAFILAALAAGAPAAAQTPYRAALEGVRDEALERTLIDASELFRLRDQPPETIQGLRRRAEADAERLRETLRAEGYYAAEVTAAVETEGAEPVARLQVEPGPVYALVEFDVLTPRGAPESAEAIAAELTLPPSETEPPPPARAADVQRRTNEALGRFGERGYPFAEIVDRHVVVDHAARSMRVWLAVDTGPFARFGETRIEGLERVSPEVVRRALTWREGEAFNLDLIGEVRRAIGGTGLFASTSIDWPETPDADGRLPVRIQVREAEHRTIGAGVSYSTSEGAGVKLFWGHDNLFGEAEQLRLEGVLAEQRQSASATLRRPWFLRADQGLSFNATVEHEAFEAYEADRARIGVLVDRRIADGLDASGGLTLEHNLVEEAGEQRVRETFDLLDLPLRLRYDASDDWLDPGRGWRFQLAVTPTVGVFDTDAQFLTVAPAGSFYLPFDKEERHVLALRGRAGAIKGESRRGIPANRRFYAGGGETVRGYGFQLVGPLDDGGQPIGGASMLAGTAEIRTRITDSFGLVAFVDAGNVYEDSTPKLDEGLRVGVGLGVRYYTRVGPLRLDLAVPLDKRRVDDDFQLYVSFGQAF